LSFIKDDIYPDQETSPEFSNELRIYEDDHAPDLQHVFAGVENCRGWGIND